MLNRYELAHLNDWDGNSIKINDNEGYILAPQMGAGRKENDNSFTGVLMGEVKKPNYSNVGLFGYSGGQRSFFLNSENGSAIFGKSTDGQVIIDPNVNRALIYSSNFWKDDAYDEQTGLPKFGSNLQDFSQNYRIESTKLLSKKQRQGWEKGTYTQGNGDTWSGTEDDTSSTETIKYYYAKNQQNSSSGIASGEGMLIDLSKPEIFFGSGKFYVRSDGSMYSIAGQIGGWKITDTSLASVSTSSNQGIVITSDGNYGNADNGRIFSGSHRTFDSTDDGFCLSESGLSIGSKVSISAEGVAKFGYLVDDNQHYWTIDGNSSKAYISYGSSGSGDYVYIGTDKIELGTTFSVTSAGKLTSSDGEIGGWTISGDSLSSGNIIISSGGSISHSDGTTSNWGIYSDGSAFFKNVTTLEGTGSFAWGYFGLNPSYATIDSSGQLSSPSGDFNTGGYSKSLYVPDGYGGTWNLSYDGIYKLVVQQIETQKLTAEEITADTVWIYEGDMKRSVEGAIHEIEDAITDLQVAVLQLQLGG